MKIIFLDIDGVLNTPNSGCGGFLVEDEKLTHENVLFDTDCIRWLGKILKKTKAKVVISSTWANHHDLKRFNDMFALYGLDDIEIVGKTRHSSQANRGEEIQEYIVDNDIINYVIIDDNDNMLESQQSHFVRD